jgi:hypothetical protein
MHRLPNDISIEHIHFRRWVPVPKFHSSKKCLTPSYWFWQLNSWYIVGRRWSIALKIISASATHRSSWYTSIRTTRLSEQSYPTMLPWPRPRGSLHFITLHVGVSLIIQNFMQNTISQFPRHIQWSGRILLNLGHDTTQPRTPRRRDVTLVAGFDCRHRHRLISLIIILITHSR